MTNHTTIAGIAKRCTRRVFPGKIFSATYDNSIEFTLWYKTEKKLKAEIYFAHAYHSWERGRNENTN